jgi:hypothetical protein
MGEFEQQEGRIESSDHNRIKRRYYEPDPNKSDEDIVKESIHLLYMDIDELLINSKVTRRYKRLMRKRITEFENPPRPQNRFILYRRNQSASLDFKNKPKEDRKVKLTSKEIATLWEDEPEEVIKLFCALERMAEKKHRKIYGDGYKPERKKRQSENKKCLSMSSYSSSTETSLESSPYLLPTSQIHASTLDDDDDDNFISDFLSNLLFDEPALPSQFSTNSILPTSITPSTQYSMNSIPPAITPSTQYSMNSIPPAITPLTQYSTNSILPAITPSTQYSTNSIPTDSITLSTQYSMLNKPYMLINIETGQACFLSNPNLNFDNFGQRMYNYVQPQQINNFLQSNSFEQNNV